MTSQRYKAEPVPSETREYVHAKGIMLTQRWSANGATLSFNNGELRLRGTLTEDTRFSRLDFQSGFAQQRITNTFGPAIADEVTRELSVQGFF